MSKQQYVSFSELPADIHIAIANQCGFQDLTRFCLVTKPVHDSCVHVLYRDIDLSIRNRGIVTVFHEDDDKQMWSDNSACTIHSEELKHKQITFLQTLTAHPEYGVHVHKLSYSMQLLHSATQDQLHPVPAWTEDAALTLHQIFQILQLLTNVREVDVAWINKPQEIYAQKSYFLPPSLCWSTTSLCLVGAMVRPLASLIFKSISASNIQHLTISNLQECGERQLPFDPNSTAELRIRASKPARKSPGAMIGLLCSLTGRCTDFKTLTLRKVGRACTHSFDDQFFKQEKAVYEEMAAFLRSVASTLEKFEFEHGYKVV